MIEELVKSLSLKEKMGQLNQRLYGWDVYTKESGKLELTQVFKDEVARFDGLGVLYGIYRSDPWSQKDLETGLSVEEGRKVIAMIQEYIKTHTTHKIPVLISEEVPHGVQGLDTTTLPSNISVGQTWNPTLVQEAQYLAGFEAAIRGIHLALVSCLDVSRDPRWGRTEECLSEDPYLTRVMAKHTVMGLQQAPVWAVAKHFAGQGDLSAGLNASPASIGERELREIHLPGLEGVVEGKCRVIMAAYNEIDGVLCHDNPWLLRTIAKDTYGFEGSFMADGVALDRLSQLAQSKPHAAARALKAGIDISLWDDVFPYLEEAVNKGLVSEDLLDEAVYRVLKLKADLGLFDDLPFKEMESPNFEAVKTLTQEGFVLLKNNANTVPVSQDKKIAVIGPNAHALYNQCGDYTPYKDLSKGSTIFEGIAQKYKATFAPGTQIVEYLDGGIENAVNIAKEADLIVVVFGGSSARDFSTSFDSNGAAVSGSNNMTCGENIDLADISIPPVQQKLIKALSRIQKPMVGLVIQGRPHVLKPIDKYFDALFVGGYPGQYGGEAFSKLLSGVAVPSGKLAMSIPESPFHIPCYYNKKNSQQNPKYHDFDPISSYPFGYGLSYATFNFKNMAISSNTVSNTTESLQLTGTICNTYSQCASEVIQVYVKHKESAIIQREKQLVAFKKIEVPVQTCKNFKLDIPIDGFKTWLPNMKHEIETGSTILLVEATNYVQEFEITRTGIIFDQEER